ncbi:MAG: OmpA family protein, partial [Campylobacter sp.]|nr:OmpA family protein [Campylobacter sp.]
MKTNNEESSFWVVYADLMAGLLFVFVLLVGGIIVKYFLTQTSLESTESALEQQKKDFASAILSLQNEEKKTAELEALNKIFNERLEELNVENVDLRKQNSIYFIQIEDLTEMAEKLKKENFDMNEILRNLEAQKNEANATITQNELKIAFLLDQLSQKESDFNQILRDLNVTKNRIRNLTGMKVKVIADIKEKLSDKISIDEESGAIKLSSQVLFDKGEAVLKDEIKNELETTLKSYFETLLNNDEIRANLDQLIIEGHTDSDGEYLYNLKLSQNRALEEMNFINSWNTDERLRKYLIDSGRSFMSPVLTGAD